ncbi:MAG TPA: endolytic transglycosylase MltG [Candidatus Paceibacterota bacterium]|nr:endolytic transglycosylase MltG [Candidatus Paceibacterota bacterium]
MDWEQIRQYAYRVFEWLYYEPSRLAQEWREQANQRSIVIIVAGGLTALLLYVLAIAPPREFPVGTLVTVPEGASAAEVGTMLEEQGVIQESHVFRIAVQILGRDRGVRAGDYLFKEPKDVFSVARAITTGAFGLEPIRIRILEGATTRDMAKVYATHLQRFNAEKFLAKAQPQEGYLFPDTYFFLPNATEDTVIEAMRQNFDAQIESLSKDIEESGRTLNDIVIMASLLEKEAHNYTDRRRIAGVLWRRIRINMALQVDAAFLYSLGRTTFSLTKADLANEEDPYNTYVHKGLPPGAIGSPSLASLRAALNPIDEGYLFYLADRNHVTHYSKTYEEHLRKKALYLGT